MALTAAEKQKRYRAKVKQDPEREAELKRRHCLRYHSKKILVKDMTEREHRNAKRRWKLANKKRRDEQKALQNLFPVTPEHTPPPTPNPHQVLGRKQVRRDRSALYRQNVKLQEELENLKRQCQKYKKRYQRAKRSRLVEDDKNKYTVLSNALRIHYTQMKNIKNKQQVQKIFDAEPIKRSRKKKILIQECLEIKQLRRKKTAVKKSTLTQSINVYFHRDDVSRATAGKRETVTYRKNKMQKRFVLDSMKHLFRSFKKEYPTLKCSYSYFVRHRPFYIKPPSIDGRNTCLCKLLTNAQ